MRKKISVSIEEKLIEQAKKQAKQENRSLSNLIEIALAQYLQKQIKTQINTPTKQLNNMGSKKAVDLAPQTRAEARSLAWIGR